MSTIQYQDKALHLVQQAYIARLHGKTCYTALAHSLQGDTTFEYQIIWQIKDGHDIDDITDEADACNWDEFEVIELGAQL